MDKKYPQDEEWLRRIRDGDEPLEKQLFHQFYEKFFYTILEKWPKLEEDEIKTIYYDSFITFLRKTKDGDLTPPLTSTLETYITGVGKKKALQDYDKKNRNKEDSTDDIDQYQKEHQEPESVKQEKAEAIKELIELIYKMSSDNCTKLFKLKIKEYSNEAIKNELNIASLGALNVRFFKCIRNLIKHPDYEYLKKLYRDIFGK